MTLICPPEAELSTSIGSLTKAVIHDDAGIIVQPKDNSAIAAAIGSLARHPVRRVQMRRASILRARDPFDIEQMLDRMEIVFSKLPASFRKRADRT